MRNTSDKGGLSAFRETTQDLYNSSCAKCPAGPYKMPPLTDINTVRGDCRLLDSMVNGSVVGTREWVRNILAQNPEIQCQAVANANRQITTVERLIEEGIRASMEEFLLRKEATQTAEATPTAIPTEEDTSAVEEATPTVEEATPTVEEATPTED